MEWSSKGAQPQTFTIRSSSICAGSEETGVGWGQSNRLHSVGLWIVGSVAISRDPLLGETMRVVAVTPGQGGTEPERMWLPMGGGLTADELSPFGSPGRAEGRISVPKLESNLRLLAPGSKSGRDAGRREGDHTDWLTRMREASPPAADQRSPSLPTGPLLLQTI